MKDSCKQRKNRCKSYVLLLLLLQKTNSALSTKIMMKQMNPRKTYLVPETCVMLVRMEQVIAASQTQSATHEDYESTDMYD